MRVAISAIAVIAMLISSDWPQAFAGRVRPHRHHEDAAMISDESDAESQPDDGSGVHRQRDLFGRSWVEASGLIHGVWSQRCADSDWWLDCNSPMGANPYCQLRLEHEPRSTTFLDWNGATHVYFTRGPRGFYYANASDRGQSGVQVLMHTHPGDFRARCLLHPAFNVVH
mmetsp:Transcript_45729/g.133147  ORF Transcript_45729/g.133147 Transcript_45729/m.133147 type:complete len:170 (-) Transcript_45729:214-723(-)